MMNVALLLQTALLFVNLMKKNAKNQVQMRMDVHYLLLVLFKNVTFMENFALFTVPENVTITKSNAQEKETIPVAKNQTSVFHYPKNYGVMMPVTGVQDFAPLIVPTGKIIAQLYKTLVMDAQLSQHANQKQRT